jgi:hypothetical protein
MDVRNISEISGEFCFDKRSLSSGLVLFSTQKVPSKMTESATLFA